MKRRIMSLIMVMLTFLNLGFMLGKASKQQRVAQWEDVARRWEAAAHTFEDLNARNYKNALEFKAMYEEMRDLYYGRDRLENAI
jgi:hypothetical protein